MPKAICYLLKGDYLSVGSICWDAGPESFGASGSALGMLGEIWRMTAGKNQ